MGPRRSLAGRCRQSLARKSTVRLPTSSESFSEKRVGDELAIPCEVEVSTAARVGGPVVEFPRPHVIQVVGELVGAVGAHRLLKKV